MGSTIESRDFYEILDVAPTAPAADIKARWKTLLNLYHPDRHTQAAEAVRRYAEDRTKLVNEAYATLSDPVKRRGYDEQRTRAATPPPAAPPTVFIEPQQVEVEVFEQMTRVSTRLDVDPSPERDDIEVECDDPDVEIVEFRVAPMFSDKAYPANVDLTLRVGQLDGRQIAITFFAAGVTATQTIATRRPAATPPPQPPPAQRAERSAPTRARPVSDSRRSERHRDGFATFVALAGAAIATFSLNSAWFYGTWPWSEVTAARYLDGAGSGIGTTSAWDTRWRLEVWTGGGAHFDAWIIVTLLGVVGVSEVIGIGVGRGCFLRTLDALAGLALIAIAALQVGYVQQEFWKYDLAVLPGPGMYALALGGALTLVSTWLPGQASR